MTTFQYFSIFLGEKTYSEDEGNRKFTLRILNTALEHRQSEPHDIYPEIYSIHFCGFDQRMRINVSRLIFFQIRGGA